MSATLRVSLQALNEICEEVQKMAGRAVSLPEEEEAAKLYASIENRLRDGVEVAKVVQSSLHRTAINHREKV